MKSDGGRFNIEMNLPFVFALHLRNVIQSKFDIVIENTRRLGVDVFAAFKVCFNLAQVVTSISID